MATFIRICVDIYGLKYSLFSTTEVCWKMFSVRTVVSRYYDTAGIRKKYHNIQTIKISSINKISNTSTL